MSLNLYIEREARATAARLGAVRYRVVVYPDKPDTFVAYFRLRDGTLRTQRIVAVACEACAESKQKLAPVDRTS